MTKLEQAARQALGALEVATTPLAKDRQEVLRAITTLREALSGVQALSAGPVGWKLVPVNPTPEMWKAAKSVPDPNPPYPPHYGLVWDAMLAASPTPPAEKQARPGAVYAELPEPDATTVGLGAVWNRHSMRDFADRTHALRASQGQASSQAGEYPALVCDYCGALTPDPWHSSGMLHGKMSKHIHSCDACAAPGVGNSGFDHQTAADFLSGKTVSDEAVRKFVAASRWAHDERAALSATLLAMHGVLTSREAEIALLKKALMEAEAAPQQEAQEPAVVDPTRWFTVVYRDISPGDEARLLGEHPKASAMSWSHAIRDRDAARAALAKWAAPQQEAQEPTAYVHVPHSTVEGKVRPVVSFEKYQQDYADGIYSTRIPLYAAPQPAPDCHHRPPCNECAALAAQGGKV